MTEEQKEKYANFLDKISEILGLNKPVDILRLCAVTDEYLRPIEKHIAELEKANEWHYPSKGEYPIDKTEMLVYFKYADYEYPCKTFGFYNGHFWDTKRGDVSNKEVIAWKEIVLPKEE